MIRFERWKSHVFFALFLVWGASQSPALVWQTAPELTSLFAEEELWSTRTIPFAELANGCEVLADKENEGKSLVRWFNHPKWPTIHTTDLAGDWSKCKALNFRIHSAESTGELVTVALLADNPATHGRDFRVATIRIDWRGWRRFHLPLQVFANQGSPLGLDRVGGVYLFTKIYNREPHPATDLLLAEPEFGAPAGELAEVIPPVLNRRVKGVEIFARAPLFDAQWLNHSYPEISRKGKLELPFRHQSYFRAARAQLGYFPRFVPGFLSVTPEGAPIILAGGHVLETCDRNGRWQTLDLLQEVVAEYAREELGYKRLLIDNTGQGGETCVRFDADGDVYVLLYVAEQGGNWKTRVGLLLHSKDQMKSWSVYRLPWYMARFEKLTGHNPDALKHPPVILQTRYHAPNESFLLVPEKKADGSLHLPDLVKIGDDTIGFLPHSGEASQAISFGESIFVVYGRMAVLPGKKKESGVPSYIVRYDRRSKTLGEPVFLGYGGKNALDNHNWPAIAADSKGILHVILNGHHNAFRYLHSLKPWDIRQWTSPVEVGAGTTYAGLVVGSDDSLYSVTRCSDPGYRFRLTLHCKRPGREWERKDLVEPFKPYYHVWYHKLVIDPQSDRLFLSYTAQSGSLCLFRDELEAFLYMRPDLSFSMLGDKEEAKLPLGTYRSKKRKYAFYAVPPTEASILLSTDRGESWRYATGEDLQGSSRK